MSKRVRVEVCPQKGRDKAYPWKVTRDGRLAWEHLTQRDAIGAARLVVELIVMEGGKCTLKIKRPNGEIREERTYPRSSDPKGTKG